MTRTFETYQAQTSVQSAYFAALVPQLTSPFNNWQWQFFGFGRQMKALLKEGCSWLGDSEPLPEFHIVPDAYYVDATNRTVYMLEIVETNDIDDTKASNISDAFWALDEGEWQLAVVLFYPKYGKTMIVDPFFLDGRAAEFKERTCPYRDAFTTLKRDVAVVQQAA